MQSAGIIQPRLGCDSLAITLNAPHDLLRHIDQLIIWSDLPRKRIGAAHYGTGARFFVMHANSAGITRVSTLTVQLRPGKTNMRDMRLAWNPAKFGPDVIPQYLEGVLSIPWPLVVAEGWVTRYDAAVDFDYVQIEDLLIYVPRVRIERSIRTNGLTRYFGSPLSTRSICVYDKRAEIDMNNYERAYANREVVPPHDRTRFEARLRPHPGIRFRDLEKLRNPFQGVQVSCVPDPESLPPKLRSLCAIVIKHARKDGLTNALYPLPKRKRAQICAAIHQAAGCPWWDPQSIWAQHPAGVVAIRDTYGATGLTWD